MHSAATSVTNWTVFCFDRRWSRVLGSWDLDPGCPGTGCRVPRRTALCTGARRWVLSIIVSAGVAKATIYRRWASKAEMVFGIVVHGETIETPAVTGALAGDLAALVRRVVTLLSAPAARQALPGLLADLRRDPLLAERFQATVIQSQREVVAAILQRAVARGELGGQPDAAAVHAQLLGTVFGWLHLMFSDPPDDLAEQVTDALLAALQARNRP